MLDGIKAGRVQTDELRLGGKQRPRTRSEVLEARADGEYHVGVPHHRVGGFRTRYTDWPGIARVARNEGGLSRNRLDDRNSVFFGERCQFGLGPRVVNATSRDNRGSFGGSQHFHGASELAAVGTRPGGFVNRCLKERLGVVKCVSGDILWQADKGWPTVTRIEHRCDRLRQGAQDLSWVRDAIPIANDRSERVVDRG